MRLLITGIAGFAGSHLAEYALAQGAEVHGTVLPAGSLGNLASVIPHVTLHPCDLAVPGAFEAVLDPSKPHWVIHLAGYAPVGEAWRQREAALRGNVLATFYLLEGLRARGFDGRFLLVSSAEVYGLLPEDLLPVNERLPLNPCSPYALTKACQELAVSQAALADRLDAVTVRPFTYMGPRQALGFVASDFAQQIAAIERGLKPPVIFVGNLASRRDITDVRDMVRAYWLALSRGESREVYNVGSGRTVSIREVLERLLAMARVPIRVEVDPSRLRPIDLAVLSGDATRFRQATGWAPEIPLEQTLADVLADWRERGGAL